MSTWTPGSVAAAGLLLAPFLLLAFAGQQIIDRVNRLSPSARLAIPALGAIPYFLAAYSTPYFQWLCVLVYAAVPVALVTLLWHAAQRDPDQRGDWRDFAVLAVLGVVVEFHYLEPAWPAQFRSLNRLLLLDTGLYGLLAVRQLTGVGFNFWPRLRDFKIGLRELVFYAPIAIPLGLGLGFLHFHPLLPSLRKFLVSWISIFAFVAILEETYFRGWIQNLLERRIGRLWFAAGDVGTVRPLALQQRRDALQLALCPAGNVCGNLLRTGVARRAAASGIRCYPRVGRRDMANLAALNRRLMPL